MISNLDLRVHHIGYLVKKIDNATTEFENLGFVVSSPKAYDDIRKADITFLTKDSYCVELISPTSEDSVVAGLMSRYKNSPYHICYETDDIEATANILTSNGYTAIDAATPAPAMEGRRVQFFMHRFMGMIELVEK